MKRFFAGAARRAREDGGFTVVEVLAASVIVTVGLLGAFLLLDVASATSAATRARSGAVNLAREITEDARSIPFSQLAPSTIVSQLQGLPGLTNAGTGSTWLIDRNGFTYTVTASECSVDDPKDGYGVHDSTFCADSTVPQGAQLTDNTPVDLKRITVGVSWTALHSTHTISEVASLTSAGEALGLQATGLQVATPAALSGSTSPSITSTGTTSMTFNVTAPSGTTAIVWTVDGAAQSWTSTNSGTTYTSSAWDISALSDGTYQVGAAAEDGNGIVGPAVTIPVILIRNIPSAPDATDYGFNTNISVGGSASTVAELQWHPNTERNVIGYRIYNPSGALICTTTQGGTSATSDSSCGAHAWCSTPASCIDLSPPLPTAANLTYQVAAVYYDANHTQQEGPRTNVTLTGTPSDTYSFAPTTQNAGSSCVGTPSRDMRGSYSPGSTDSTATGSITFCSDSSNSGDTVQGGGTATAYFVNPGAASCQVTGTLSTDGGTTGAVTATSTIPNGTTTATAHTFTFTNNQTLTMNAGDELDLKFDMSASGCGSTVLHYGSTGAPGVFQTPPIPVTPPGPPASLTATAQPDGTAVLTWPAPTTGAPVSFYRIYRDGTDYTNRYTSVPTTACNSGTCTYTDTGRNSAHAYSVTAVGGTTAGANMAESTTAGPVTN